MQLDKLKLIVVTIITSMLLLIVLTCLKLDLLAAELVPIAESGLQKSIGTKTEKKIYEAKAVSEWTVPSPGKYSLIKPCVIYDSLMTKNGWNSSIQKCNNSKIVETVDLGQFVTMHSMNRVFSTKQLQHEKFTVVIPTYDRLTSLMTLIKEFNETANLDKVLVIWNNPIPLPKDIQWPKIDVQVQVITNGRNSLNNKNIPFSQIQTEAIFHHDDDLKLTKEEIQAAFRVWQVNRDNMVGYLGRSLHYKNGTYKYLGPKFVKHYYPFILAGCCFVSKYYSFTYTFVMDERIRHSVDKHMNCEDIALSFLIANTIHKRPMPVILKENLNRKMHRGTLSGRPGHYIRRGHCADEFVRIYGHMPLLAQDNAH